MANASLATPLGPLFGPNFILITVNDENNRPFPLEIYPDSNNPLLKESGLATHYYFQPQRVYLAKKQDDPATFDFGATVFKGLMTTENTVGVTDAMTVDGVASAAGGFCSFATTFAIPDSVIAKATVMLKNQDFPAPPNFGKFAHLFLIGANDPTPQLGIVPIVSNNVTIEVPNMSGVGTAAAPFFIDAQGTGKGSIEATSISAFLVTMNMLSAGAIVGSLKAGVSPFTVHYNTTQQFYINAIDVTIHVDMTKTYDAFSAAISVNYFGIVSANLSEAWSQCVTSGAITTDMKMGLADVDPDLKKMVEQQVQDLQKFAMDAVTKDIFNFSPNSTPATADSNSLVGVSMKAEQDRRTDKFDLALHLETSVIIADTASGDLNDLEPEIKAHLDKYLAIVDIGQFFQKVQIAATNNVSWSEKLLDGTDLSDPIKSIQVQASYPDISTPVSNNQPNLVSQAQGFHYTIGNVNPKGPGELAVWTKDNPNDIINISFLRLNNSIPQWDSDQVQITKTIVYDPSDPRVEISTGSIITVSEVTKNHAPVITPDEVGYVFVRFLIAQKLPPNVSMTLTCSIGNRKDILPTITGANQKNILWEIFSDKYSEATSFQYDLQIEVTGPNFTDIPVTYGTTHPITIPLQTGRIKYISGLTLPLPIATAEQNATINQYIKAVLNPAVVV
jgi:hypothetical protein